MFIAGVTHSERRRGTGWTTCPNCNEYTANDVIDDMRFIALFFYRFAPIGKRRYLVCEHCSFRRFATPADVAALETAGAPIKRAWFAPFGVVGIAAVVALLFTVGTVSNGQNALLANQKIILTTRNGGLVAPLVFKAPLDWSYTADNTADPPMIRSADGGGRMYFVINRFDEQSSLSDLIANHFQDQSGLGATNFPTQSPIPSQTAVGNLPALSIDIQFKLSGDPADITMYAFQHDRVNYTLTYVALGDSSIKTLRDIASLMLSTLHFTADESPVPSSISSPTQPTGQVTPVPPSPQ